MSEAPQLIARLGAQARTAAAQLALLATGRKNLALHAMADAVLAAEARILAANAEDVAGARAAGLSVAMIDRLTLTPDRLAGMARGIREVAAAPDPVGAVLREWTQPNGLRLAKVRVPIGVIGFIYESRPNVTTDAAALCLKSGNAVILRGGSEALRSNQAIAAAITAGLKSAGVPAGAVQLVATADRDAVRALCEARGHIDLLIPRGGKGLIETVVAHARMPVVKHYDGICAVYVDAAADPAMARDIILDAKCQRPGVCNAAETLLVHRDVAGKFLAEVAPALLAKGTQLRCDPAALATLPAAARAKAVSATAEDFRTEFLDLVLAVKVVGSLDEAIAHIAEHGSHHTDAIVTSDAAAAERFLREVDSASVLWNASTRMADGGEYGFGAEIGISTDKVHARGPMGLEDLTSYKYVARGSGQLRS